MNVHIYTKDKYGKFYKELFLRTKLKARVYISMIGHRVSIHNILGSVTITTSKGETWGCGNNFSISAKFNHLGVIP